MGCCESHIEYDDSYFLKAHPGEKMSEHIMQIHGQERNIITWAPESSAPKAVVLVSHGLYEHAGRYYGVAHALVDKGYIVYGIDHNSHGKSAGTPGLVSDYKLFARDFIFFSEAMRKKHPTLPFFVLSHSVGTLVAILSINKLPFVQVCKARSRRVLTLFLLVFIVIYATLTIRFVLFVSVLKGCVVLWLCSHARTCVRKPLRYGHDNHKRITINSRNLIYAIVLRSYLTLLTSINGCDDHRSSR
jgi:hypothetical protein